MSWIRLSDNYVDHPKFFDLSDGAFRLWHEAMAYCRRHQTDGLFSFQVMKAFRSFTHGREKQLATPHRPDAAPLWELVPKMGYKVHDYLEWNPSKDEENERRADSKARMRLLREQRTAKGVAPLRSSVSTNKLQTTLLERSQNVPDTDTEERSLKENVSEKKPAAPSIEERASRLREEWYPAWYAKYRNGARLRIPLIANSLEFQEALSLVQTWDDARLEKLARIVLTTNEDFIAGTDRGFKIFALKASWAEDRLIQAELQNASKA